VLTAQVWVVERFIVWEVRFRRLAKDYERLSHTVTGLHFIAFVCLFLHRAIRTRVESLTPSRYTLRAPP
jgi:transposase